MQIELIAPMLLTLATNAPWIIVAMIGIVIAATRAGAHPQVAKLLIIIIIAKIGLTVISAITSLAIPLMVNRGRTVAEVGMLSAGISLCMSFLRAALLALTLWAALGWRKPAAYS